MKPAIPATESPQRSGSAYPPHYARLVAGRSKHILGDQFGLTNFGVNLTTLKPGAQSALRHVHHVQDEFIYALEGEAVLLTNAGETVLRPGMCAGFKAGNGDAHCLVNRSDRDFLYLEIGDRSASDVVDYPDDDLAAAMGPDGKWRFTRKDGSAW